MVYKETRFPRHSLSFIPHRLSIFLKNRFLRLKNIKPDCEKAALKPSQD